MKRGSALLIVLGMLSFMVISAVAFSAYMRYSRLPSSFLRRSSSSRLLVKAALAEAIDEIDAAIGNNPHPGIGTRAPRATAGLAASDLGGLNADMRTRNHWRNRVYIGTNELHSAEDTVSTLTLEGLAYIPPPLVNEARYYSRRSQAGCWKRLGFDSGRYAFCAIDVSDFFDVNALLADSARSSAPGSRISLAYLFENAAHTSASGSSGSPSAWDNFMKQFTDDGKVPLVSMADWNLAVNQDTPGGMMSQFCQYIRENRTSFYGGIGDEGEAAEAIRNQAFVTDSWFPVKTTYTTSAGGSISPRCDLNDGKNQPFTRSELRSDMSLFAIAAGNSLVNNLAIRQYEQSLSGLGFAALYDYLDRDDTPISLAIPTTERVPMICALSPGMASAALTVEAKVVEGDGENAKITPKAEEKVGAAYTMTYHVQYSIKGLPTAPTEALVTYPFRHGDVVNSSNYELGGRMAYFLTSEGSEVGLRTGSVGDILHVGYKGANAISSYTAVDDAVLTLPFAAQDLSPAIFNVDSQGAEGAVKLISLTPSGILPQSVMMLDVTYTGEDVYINGGTEENPRPVPKRTAIDLSKDNVTQATCNWKPLTSDGRLDAAFAANLVNTLKNAGFERKLKVNLAVWAWVKNKTTGKYVDMVPACLYDDIDLNSKNNDMVSKTWSQQYLGGAYPLMRFDMAADRKPLLAYASANVAKGVVAQGEATQMEVTPQSVMVCDPRYNHAPESWFSYAGNISESVWLENNESGLKKQPTNNIRRDGDIFMQVSDQEYLQSAYELANLPRLTDFYQVGATWEDHGWYRAPDATRRDAFVSAVTDTANFDYMWRTYDPTPRYRDGGDNFDECGFVNDGNGFKVTPFSNITNIIMAAFANTPHEWRVAGTNDEAFGAANVPVDSQFNRKYAWNEYSSGAKIQWLDLEDLAATFMEETRRSADRIASGSETWEDVWADLGWYDFNRTGDEWSKYLLTDMQLGDTSGQGRIWNTDRKFLYGYWHDCFAIRQQLFLVFVRAEPAMMGGGARGQTPPQLGARAVALVWRDPTSSPDERTPHRTRILFYRQFD